MQFDLSQYETVKERKKRFYKDYPEGRIVVELVNNDLEEKAVIKATVYLNANDQKDGIPRSSGYALELRDKTLQTNKYGKQYESVNYSSWLENAEESAIGRALDNAGYSGNDKCSREEIEKAQRNAKASRPGQKEKDVLLETAKKNNVNIETVKEMLTNTYKTDKLSDLTFEQYKELLVKIEGWVFKT